MIFIFISLAGINSILNLYFIQYVAYMKREGTSVVIR